MNRLRDKRSILFLAATALLSIAFAFTLAHSFEHDHDEEHAFECSVCLWSTTLFLAGCFITPALHLVERPAAQFLQVSRLTSSTLLRSGRSPPTLQ